MNNTDKKIDEIQHKLWVIMRGTATPLKAEVFEFIKQALSTQRKELEEETEETKLKLL
jgi:hypothetical protein